MWFILLILTILAGPAQALTYVACDPVTIVGTQGRPIPNATVAITTTAGVPATSLFWDASGTMVYDGTVPTSGVLQVFSNPGTYIFTVQGQGLMRRYYARCGEGLGEGVKTVSVSRTADMYVAEGSAGLFCPGGGGAGSTPCYLRMRSIHADDGARISFIMPSFELVFKEFLLSYIPATANTPVGAKTRWYVDWCKYEVNQAKCEPDGTNLQKFTSVSNGVTKRTDLALSAANLSTDWLANDVVVLKFWVEFHDNVNQVDDVDLFDARLEFDRN